MDEVAFHGFPCDGSHREGLAQDAAAADRLRAGAGARSGGRAGRPGGGGRPLTDPVPDILQAAAGR